MGFAIRTQKLCKNYGSLKAVDAIGLEVLSGELFGFLGPNGAGKTTTISMLSTLLAPSSGKAFVNGFDVSLQKDEVRKSIGVVFQDPSIDDELTGYENIELHGLLYGVEEPELSKRIRQVLDLVGLWEKRDALVKEYSGGMKRRLEIARGLLHHPKILFLDEPTIGLDPQTRRGIWDYIRKMNQEEKVTVILTTHYMEEADALCNRMVVIDHGKIIAQGTPAELKHSMGGDVIYVKATGDCEKQFRSIPGVSKVSRDAAGDFVVTAHDGEKMVPLLFQHAGKCGATISSVSVHEPTLEDVFIKLTGKTIREQEGEPLAFMRNRIRSKMR